MQRLWLYHNRHQEREYLGPVWRFSSLDVAKLAGYWAIRQRYWAIRQRYWAIRQRYWAISQFHNLFQHLPFAITDFIYVRKFRMEMNVEITK